MFSKKRLPPKQEKSAREKGKQVSFAADDFECPDLQPGCSIFNSENIHLQFPALRVTPRAEPDPFHPDHVKWEKEYAQWEHLTCPAKRSYFCRAHGRWISCQEIQLGAASRKRQGRRSCPSSHYASSPGEGAYLVDNPEEHHAQDSEQSYGKLPENDVYGSDNQEIELNRGMSRLHMADSAAKVSEGYSTPRPRSPAYEAPTGTNTLDTHTGARGMDESYKYTTEEFTGGFYDNEPTALYDSSGYAQRSYFPSDSPLGDAYSDDYYSTEKYPPASKKDFSHLADTYSTKSYPVSSESDVLYADDSHTNKPSSSSLKKAKSSSSSASPYTSQPYQASSEKDVLYPDDSYLSAYSNDPKLDKLGQDDDYSSDAYTPTSKRDSSYLDTSYTSGQYTTQPKKDGSYPEQPFPRDPYTLASHKNDPYTEDLYPSGPYTSTSRKDDSYPEEPYSSDPYTIIPQKDDSYPEEPYPNDPYEGTSKKESSYPDEPYPSDPYSPSSKQDYSHSDDAYRGQSYSGIVSSGDSSYSASGRYPSDTNSADYYLGNEDPSSDPYPIDAGRTKVATYYDDSQPSEFGASDHRDSKPVKKKKHHRHSK